jgi:hypothetical protein
MKRVLSIIGLFLLSLLLLGAECDILSFSQKPLVVDLTIQMLSHAQSNTNSYNGQETINLAQEYADLGIPAEKIKEINIKNIQIVITENMTGPNIEISNLLIQIALVGSTTYITLAEALNVGKLNDILNSPINPWSTALTLGVKTNGVETLIGWLDTSPPPNFVMRVNTTLSGSPVDFKATTTLEIQVKYQP